VKQCELLNGALVGYIVGVSVGLRRGEWEERQSFGTVGEVS